MPAPDFARSVRANHNWLEHHNLLNRPWFILGSAPNPVIPSQLPHGTVYAYVKFAGRSAKQRALPPGDITLATGWERERWDDLDLSLILRVRNKTSLRTKFSRLFRRPSHLEHDLFSHERDDYVLQALRSRFRGVGQHVRPSSALTFIAFAIVHEIPEILISGLSLDQLGHAYDTLNSPRKHVPEDRAALQAAASLHPHVRTTEPRLAAATGLPLYTGRFPER